ncbi:MAG: hypothetical protein ABEJ40_10370 [Haloarculaceae archaeon]
MDRLSSCYFCGAALDASLDEYPVVPESLHPGPDAQKTVVLCPTCKRKLDGVLDVVVGAVEARAGAPTGDAGSDVETTLGDDADVLRSVGSGDGDGDGDGEPDPAETDEAGAESVERGSTGDGTGRGTTEDRDDGESASGESGGDDAAGSEPRGEDAPDSRTSGADAADEDPDGDDVSEVTLTRLENTKVMRLLQNREFPVDREEFVTVASSAYEVSPRDCDKVIDLAVEHDLLDERDGQLHAGSRWS